MIHLDWSYDEIVLHRYLHRDKETAMPTPYTESDLREELQTAPAEPLLPIEKKLIGWSLTIGLGLLVVLAAVNYLL